MRPSHRKPPRQNVDKFSLAYDYVPRLGWGTYPARADRGSSTLVWEENFYINDHATILQRISDDSLRNVAALVQEMA